MNGTLLLRNAKEVIRKGVGIKKEAEANYAGFAGRKSSSEKR